MELLIAVDRECVSEEQAGKNVDIWGEGMEKLWNGVVEVKSEYSKV